MLEHVSVTNNIYLHSIQLNNLNQLSLIIKSSRCLILYFVIHRYNDGSIAK